MIKRIGIKKEKLLERIVAQRIAKKLDKVVGKDKDYQDAVREQDEAFGRMDKLVLDKKQRIIVDKAISASNHCGAVYGIAAYRLGLHDGIRLMSEVKEIINQR